MTRYTKACRRSFEVLVRVRQVLLVLALMALAACAHVPGSPGFAGSSAGAQQPGGDLRNTTVKQQLDQALRPRGWLPIGFGRGTTTTDADAFYLNFLALKRDGDSVIVPQLTVLSSAAAATQGTAAITTIREFNCSNRTWRVVEAQGFDDRMATAKSKQTSAPMPTALPIPSGTIVQTVYTAMCEGSSSGTGVVVANGRVLTNSHVVDRCRKLEASFAGTKYASRITAQDKGADLALLEVTGLPDASALPVRRAPISGEAVTVAGFPLSAVLGNDMNVQIGIVNSLAGINNNIAHFQVSATMQPGNSGGPVLDKTGNLLGLSVAKLSADASARLNANNVNFAIKPQIIRLFLSTNQVVISEADAGERLETEQVAERAKKVTVKVECSQRIAGI